jgi:hypothetical protein
MDLRKQETVRLINVADKSGRIYLTGTLAEKKKQLLERLKVVDEMYNKRK